MKKLSSVLSVIFVFVLASVLVFCNMSYVKADNEKAAAGVRYETITIDQDAINGNAIWGATEDKLGVEMDNYARFYSAQRNSDGGLPADGMLKMPISKVPYKLVTGDNISKAYDGMDCIRLTSDEKKRTRTLNLQTIGEPVSIE